MIALAVTAALSPIQPALAWYPCQRRGDHDRHEVEGVRQVPGGDQVGDDVIDAWRAQPSEDAHDNLGKSACSLRPLRVRTLEVGLGQQRR